MIAAQHTMRVAGLAFLTPEEREREERLDRLGDTEQPIRRSSRDLDHDAHAGREASRRAMTPRARPAKPPFIVVLRAPDGMTFISIGDLLLPYFPVPSASDDVMRTGGFLPIERLGSATGGAQDHAVAMAMAAAFITPAGGVSSVSREGAAMAEDPSAADAGGMGEIASALYSRGLSMAQSALTAAFGPDAPAMDLKQFVDPSGGMGIPKSLGNSALGMGLGAAVGELMSMWGTDDASPAAEQLSKEAAKKVVGHLQSQAQAQLSNALGLSDADPKSLSDKLAKYLSGPTSSANIPALRLGDTDVKGNAVAAASGDVVCEGKPMARMGDPVPPKGVQVYQGSGTVLTNDIQTGRADSVSAEGPFTTFASTVFVGGPKVGDAPAPEDQDGGQNSQDKNDSDNKKQEQQDGEDDDRDKDEDQDNDDQDHDNDDDDDDDGDDKVEKKKAYGTLSGVSQGTGHGAKQAEAEQNRLIEQEQAKVTDAEGRVQDAQDRLGQAESEAQAARARADRLEREARATELGDDPRSVGERIQAREAAERAQYDANQAEARVSAAETDLNTQRGELDRLRQGVDDLSLKGLGKGALKQVPLIGDGIDLAKTEYDISQGVYPPEQIAEERRGLWGRIFGGSGGAAGGAAVFVGACTLVTGGGCAIPAFFGGLAGGYMGSEMGDDLARDGRLDPLPPATHIFGVPLDIIRNPHSIMHPDMGA